MNFLSDYIDWHFFRVWPAIITASRNLTLFPFYFFSIGKHFLTLFSPWKRQRISSDFGLDILAFLNALVFNTISRMIGAVMRVSLIMAGLVLTVLFFIIFLPALLWPVFVFLSIPFYVLRKRNETEHLRAMVYSSGGSSPEFIGKLFSSHQGRFIAKRLGLDMGEFAREFPKMNLRELQVKILYMKNISFRQVFTFLLSASEFSTYLEKKSLNAEDFKKCLIWYGMLYEERNRVPLILDFDKIRHIQGLGYDWSYAYTPILDRYAVDMTRKYFPYPLLFGREKEILMIEEILGKITDNSCLVVGEPGVGRHILIESLALRIKSGLCKKYLRNKRLMFLDLHQVLSSADTREKAKGMVEDIFLEAEYAGDVIIVIDDFDKFSSSQDSRVDLGDVICSAAQSDLSFIGLTSPFNYHKYVETNSSLNLVFEKVFMNPPSESVMMEELLYSIIPPLEKRHSVEVTYKACARIIENSQNYLQGKPFPAKAVETAESAVLYSVEKGSKYITPEIVDRYFSERLGLEVGELHGKESELLLRLEEELHRRIINQTEAVGSLSSALRRSRLGISSRQKPVGTFLFLGPTGVGKTETAKSLADIFFRKKGRLVRFDMSQFHNDSGIEMLLGSPSSGQPGLLSSAIRDNPYSVILLDEFEKSTDSVYNIFLTLLDEGYINDGFGRKVSANNCIIIATSNAGSEYVRENVMKGIPLSDLKKGLVEHILTRRIFSPELVNRFDAVIVFTPLSEGHLREVTKKMLESLNDRLKDKGITLKIDSELIRRVISSGYDSQFGARGISRYISENIEDDIAKKVISGSVKKGEIISL